MTIRPLQPTSPSWLCLVEAREAERQGEAAADEPVLALSAPRFSMKRRQASRFGTVRWCAIGALIAAVYAPPLILHGQRLWDQSYYQFFPIFVPLVIGLVVHEILSAPSPESGRWRLAPFSLGMSAITLIAAAWIRSPWLATLSFLLLGDGLLSWFASARRIWRVLIVLLPLPFQADQLVTNWLQRISSRGASHLLELSGIPHLINGNVLEVPDRHFFVEDACSGLSSVYLLVAMTALYVTWAHVRLVRSIPLLLTVPLWAMVANVVRIFTIVCLWSRWNIDLSHGWPHEITGLLTSVFAMLGILSTRSLLDLVFDPVSLKSGEDDPYGRNWFLHTWNAVTLPKSRDEVQTSTRGLSVQVAALHRALGVLLVAVAAAFWSNLLAAPATDTSETVQLPELTLSSFDDLKIPDVRFLESEIDHADALATSDGGYRWSVEMLSGQGGVMVRPADLNDDVPALCGLSEWKIVKRRPRNNSTAIAVQLATDNGQHGQLYYSMLRPQGEAAVLNLAGTRNGIPEYIDNQIQNLLDPGATQTILVTLLITSDTPAAPGSEDTEFQLFRQVVAVVRRQLEAKP